MATPDPIPINPRHRNRAEVYERPNVGYDRPAQPNYRPYHEQGNGDFNALQNIPVWVRVIAIIFALMIVRLHASGGNGVKKHRIKHRQSQNTSQSPKRHRVDVSGGYSHIILRSYPAGCVRFRKRRINTPSRKSLKVRSGFREFKFVPNDWHLFPVKVRYSFSPGTKYEVVVNFMTGKSEVRVSN